MSKFKKGDKVYLNVYGERIEGFIVAYGNNYSGYLFKSFEEHKLLHYADWTRFIGIEHNDLEEENLYFYAGDEQLELIEESSNDQFTKSDLKNGMVVKLRKGVNYLVINETLICENAFKNISRYDNDMKNADYMTEFDIIEVFETSGVWLSDLLDDKRLTSIWKREEYKEEKICLQNALELLSVGKEVIIESPNGIKTTIVFNRGLLVAKENNKPIEFILQANSADIECKYYYRTKL